MNKDRLLQKISQEIAECKICRQNKLGKAVPGEGNPDAKVVFIGEAPGKKEAETGRPFVGRSGQLLRQLIRETLILKEKDVYITSPVKYLPIYKTPKPSDIAHGKIHLGKQLNIIRPKIIVLLGSVAQKALLKTLHPVIKEHGTIVEEDGRKFLITLHPAAALRFPQYRKLIEEDFKKINKLL